MMVGRLCRKHAASSNPRVLQTLLHLDPHKQLQQQQGMFRTGWPAQAPVQQQQQQQQQQRTGSLCQKLTSPQQTH
jgi:hypothetical protein